MKYLFKSGAVFAILLSVMFNSSVFADDTAPSASGPLAQVQKVSDNSSYVVACLQGTNTNMRHMLEESPMCEGMAPPKSQAADHSIRNSLSSAVMRTSETSRTSINPK